MTIIRIKTADEIGDGYASIGLGIWCGIWYILAGAFGVAAARKPTRCLLVNLLGFSIIAALVTLPYSVLNGLFAWRIHWGSSENEKRVQTYFTIMLLSGLLAGVSTIILSAMICRAICRVKAGGQVIYNPEIDASQLQNATGQAYLGLQIAPPPQMDDLPPAYHELGAQYELPPIIKKSSSTTKESSSGHAEHKPLL